MIQLSISPETWHSSIVGLAMYTQEMDGRAIFQHILYTVGSKKLTSLQVWILIADE